jgi:hypothetical protein
MSIVQTILMFLATGGVLMRCFGLVSVLNRKKWVGHPFEFTGFSSAIALTAGGAVGVLLGSSLGPLLLLTGVAAWMFFDRRF